MNTTGLCGIHVQRFGWVGHISYALALLGFGPGLRLAEDPFLDSLTCSPASVGALRLPFFVTRPSPGASDSCSSIS